MYNRINSLRWLRGAALAVGLTAVPVIAPSALAETTWEDQAERLQNVSATLLDAFPFSEPVQRDASLEAKAGVSFLPDVNPRVGAKKEKVPSSPVHAVPTLQANARLRTGVSTGSLLPGEVGFQAWGGYLPAGGEKLFGIDAKLTQWLVGGAVSPAFAVAGLDLFFTFGVQHSSADLKGAITAEDADDSFQSKTLLLSVAPGVLHRASGVWGNLQVSRKKTESTFEIPSDGTKFDLEDDLGDASVPVATQVSAGWLHTSGLQVGGSLLHVPERLVMPRLLLSYQYAF